MKLDLLVAEIGSTTTIVNAFKMGKDVQFLGRGVSNTTVDVDVRNGLKNAISDLVKNLQTSDLEYKEMFASSSAAGGLKMTVSGLVYEMTVRAAKEAALNAGANIHFISAGDLEEDDLERISDIKPNIILIAGGTDYGEKNVGFNNFKKIESLKLTVPIVYAGNIENHYRILKYYESCNPTGTLKLVENVYPRVDYLNINPLRKVIYETFEEHIVHAKGMKHIKAMVNGSIMPTPGSVMEATMRLNEFLGNILTIDVGGATTDVHSITLPSDEYKKYSEGEAKEKRTVEGDLGVFINHKNVMSYLDKDAFIAKHNISIDILETLLDDYKYIPETSLEKALVYELTRICVYKALDRHIGDLKRVFTTNGHKVIPDGRDLTQIQSVVLTGGALVNLKNTEEIIKDYFKKSHQKLVPKETVKIYKDYDYVMASLGVMSLKYPEDSLTLLKKSLRIVV